MIIVLLKSGNTVGGVKVTVITVFSALSVISTVVGTYTHRNYVDNYLEEAFLLQHCRLRFKLEW